MIAEDRSARHEDAPYLDVKRCKTANAQRNSEERERLRVSIRSLIQGQCCVVKTRRVVG